MPESRQKNIILNCPPSEMTKVQNLLPQRMAETRTLVSLGVASPGLSHFWGWQALESAISEGGQFRTQLTSGCWHIGKGTEETVSRCIINKQKTSTSSYIICPFPDFNWSIKSPAKFGLAQQVLT